MLRLILIFTGVERQGYVDPDGVCYELDGTIITGGFEYTTLDNNPPQPGWYTPPPPPPAPPEPDRLITRLAFRNRFTATEKATIELLAAHNPGGTEQSQQLAAALRASLADQRDATFINLDRADTRGGVLQLEALTILAAGRALQILDAPISPEERYHVNQ